MNMREEIINQHLIDPELCIRCNNCEEKCPTGAVTNDGRNYVVNAELCNACMSCTPGCPTGAINVWRPVRKDAAYSTTEQYQWTELPAADAALVTDEGAPQVAAGRGAPASAMQPRENLYTRNAPAIAVVKSNQRITDPASSSDIHHIVLGFGSTDFPFFEGQSIGILPPGLNTEGKPHQMRLYSIASKRDGEENVRGNLALTIKRVVDEYQGQPYHGICSNYVCDLSVGTEVEVVGPFGASFLMPDDQEATIVMICTGTGIAPMRGMIEQRYSAIGYRQGKLALFYGGRTVQDLPYHAELKQLPTDFLDFHIALSRVPNVDRLYVQDLIEKRPQQVASWLTDDNCYIYMCGLKGMESGVLDAFAAVCEKQNLNWETIQAGLDENHRLHIETY
ncbi:benzoyl-CoA 2,3-epoxidase subunit BoxA [Ferribacterium limneticum]|uniref:benzoyl-CoA 2,3-epoxidase subunit BoxA n=1 Tax=Ferribacterium limneticum TaxID=76259 RepID=UPI001CF8A3B4|nr:benzoyl-CoA 2,3-epoxidase subunit BoxA [Ferribacterium limneticum]UCV23646.1 benzoyl-CoA 2,3-epoxidase subunit BoxA [Ferribacterium limneticum]